MSPIAAFSSPVAFQDVTPYSDLALAEHYAPLHLDPEGLERVES